MPDGPPADVPTELDKILPVIFMVVTIATQYCIYVLGHCLPLLQLSVPADQLDNDVRFRALVETSVFHVITFLLILSYAQCVLVHPGTVPSSELWMYSPEAALLDVPGQERKKSGERRHCKWCAKFKPDRCHHCRVCRMCILKMDHHCPWIYNCVGFHNYKFFFLLLMYSVLCMHMILWTMVPSTLMALVGNAPFWTMFGLLFGLSLAFVLGGILTLFFLFHVWLVWQGLSTIEFCEKVLPQTGQMGWSLLWDCDSKYSMSAFRNFQQLLGDNILFWFLPITTTRDDGLVFEVRLSLDEYLDLEAHRGHRRTGKSKGGSRQSLTEPRLSLSYGATTKPNLYSRPGSSLSYSDLQGEAVQRSWRNAAKTAP